MPIQKRILVSILNWGLGHASRCIPIINELERQGVEVIIASDGRALALLKKEFPYLICLPLPPYDITYKRSNMFVNIGFQLPKILKAIRQEQKDIQKIVKTYQIDAIISDNRFGCYSKQVPSIFMTHQVNLHIPILPVRAISNFLNQRFIQKFDACWIPDFEGVPNLAGQLSHDFSLDKVHYLGALSRMKQYSKQKKQDVILVLSGPEPQRTYLEAILLEQMRQAPQNFLIIQGITDGYKEENLADNIKSISFLTSTALNDAMLESDIVISRSGYSTLMDLVYLKKQAILIPTPGQTEQEYLAAHFEQQGIFYTQTQSGFDLATALEQVKDYSGFDTQHFPESPLKKVIANFLEKL